MAKLLEFDEGTSIIIDRMKDFCFYFIRRLEIKYAYYLQILEEDSKGADKPTLGGTVLASGAALVPTIGRGLGTALAKGDKFLSNRSDKSNAVRLSDLVYYHAKSHDVSRKSYQEVAYELFACYEKQFMQITCKGGVTRAIEKLAYDAADRLISSLLHSDAESILPNISKKTMIEGIVENQGNFLQDWGLMKIGRTVKTKNSGSKEKSWKSSEIYTKVGVYSIEPPSFYSNDQCNIDIYGFRLCFPFETEESLMKNYDQLNNSDNSDYSQTMHCYTFSPNDFTKYYDEIDKYYHQRTSPIQADLKEKHEETLSLIEKIEDRAQKDRDGKHDEIMTSVLEQQDVIKFDHGEQKQREEAILTKLDQVYQKQEETQEQVKQISEHSEPSGTITINKDRINTALKSIDPTKTGEFKKFKRFLKRI